MNVLLVGSGGREHALAWSLSKSPRLKRLFAMPGSSGIAVHAECLAGDPSDAERAVTLCRERGVELAVIGPEAPLAAGVADALRSAGVSVLGPGARAARLESSKSFAKDFMRRHRVPTAEAEVYDDPTAAEAAAAAFPLPLVVKADGLAAGKGVRVCRARGEALEAVRDFMERGALGPAGERVLLERCLDGPEATVMAFCDGKTLVPLPVSRDHKRVGDGDSGPNTGGMGAFAPVELAPETRRLIRSDILDRTLAGLAADRIDYRGVLYCGLMLTTEGPRLLEYNVRFGDPETQAALPLLETDLLELAQAAAAGRLSSIRPAWRDGYAVAVVLASEGYPGTPRIGRRIEGLDRESDPGVTVFHAGTVLKDGAWLTSGGRVLSVSAVGATVAQARAKAYAAAGGIRFEGMRYRKDIALAAEGARA